MTEQQFKRWMLAKTRQYIWLIVKKDPNRVKISFMHSFDRSFKRSCGVCSKELQHIYYRTDFIKNGWDCDFKALENLIIHEVCHLKYDNHGGEFFTEYRKWSGDDFISRWSLAAYDATFLDADDGKSVSHVVGLPSGGYLGCVD